MELFSATAENIVISHLLNNSEQFEEFGVPLNKDFFSLNENRDIFDKMEMEFERNKKYTYTSIEKYFSNKEIVKTRKSHNPDVIDFSVNLELVKEYKGRRDLFNYLNSFKKDIADNVPYEDMVNNFNNVCNVLNTSLSTDSVKGIKDIIKNTEIMFDAYERNDGSFGKVDTGYEVFDEKVGLYKNNLVILGARPSMGKSVFALNLIHKALMDGKNVMLFSLEMKDTEIAKRMLSKITRIPMNKLKDTHGWQTLKHDEKLALAGANKNTLGKFNLHISDDGGMTINELKIQAKKVHAKNKLDVIVIDYLQLLTVKGSYGEDRNGEVSRISRELKQLAGELNVPIICLAQLNRAVENREGGMPKMSDLRDSGSIEQDADIILFINRPAFSKTLEAYPGQTFINVAKNRNGSLGEIQFEFEGMYQNFNEKGETDES